MLLRKLLGGEWKSPDAAFYSKPVKHLLRGGYWSFLFQGDGKNPQVWVMVYHIFVPHTLNGVRSHATETNGKTFGTMTACWYFDKGKMRDLFTERSMTSVSKLKMTSTTESGYVLELSGKFPSYKATLKKGGKTILSCESRGPDFSRIKPLKYENIYNVKSYLDGKSRFYCQMGESLKLSQITKLSNVFTNVRMSFLGKPFKGRSYAEKNHTAGVPIPWKYLIFDLKDGSAFRMFWSFRAPIFTKSDFDITFDFVKNGKKYFFENPKKLKHKYIEKDGTEISVFSEKTKYISLESENKDGARISILAEVLGDHCYLYKTPVFKTAYHQHILKLRKLELIDGGKAFRPEIAGSHTYGEYTTLFL